MSTLNRVELLGFLGQDPKVISLTMTSFSVATNYMMKNNNGEFTKQTEWHDIITFNKQAEVCAQYLKKGSHIWLEGRLQTNTWTDKNGEPRSKLKIIANKVIFLDKKDDTTNKPQNSEPYHPTPYKDDDIPF